VERRAASGAVGGDAGTMQARVFEVTERHEEPVVEKRVPEAEEVVVQNEPSPDFSYRLDELKGNGVGYTPR
jgi:Domain of unknown function (DUF2382)